MLKDFLSSPGQVEIMREMKSSFSGEIYLYYLEYSYFSSLKGELCFYCSYFSSTEQLEVLSLQIFILKLLITFQQMTQKERERFLKGFKEIMQKKIVEMETIKNVE